MKNKFAIIAALVLASTSVVASICGKFRKK